MSMRVKIKTTYTAWIFLVSAIINMEFRNTLPIYPTSGDWTCNAGRVLRNQTISAGIQAGQFKKAGNVNDITKCIRYCCDEEKCDVALMAKGNCYLVSCNNKILCRPVPAQSTDLSPQISYVTHTKLNRKRLPALETFLTSQEIHSNQSEHYDDLIERPENNHRKQLEFRLQAMTKQVQDQKRVVIQDGDDSTKLTKAEKFFNQQGTPTSSRSSPLSSVVISENCYPAQIHTSVSLRYGPDSGDFYDYGEIGDMRQCVDLCCKDKLCDVSFMVGKTCYTVSCYTLEKCQMIPSSKKAKLTSQLAYVIKETDIQRKQKLTISKKHENFLEIERHRQDIQPWRFDRERDGTFHAINRIKNIVLDEPNIPESLTKHCRHNRIMKNHALIGGQKAGVYIFRGLTPGFNACLNLCCADLFCDAAFLLDKRCYSVQCYKNGKCASRSAESKSLQSTLAFIERSDQLGISEKRTSIPGLLPSDRQYTVWLNITNEEYKDEMIDTESLEFLNFAEKLRGMVGGLYGNVDGFKYVEVLKFRPKILVAIFNITADKATNPKILLQKMVDVLRTGELRTHEEPVATRLSVDVRGFKFLNTQGNNMVCPPEYNYDVHWPLGVYGTFVSVPCPRKANGLTTRQCSGNESRKASWLIPDFSDCITEKYETLIHEVQLLTSSSLHTPDLTSASIIDRLLQLVTKDTYGENPPIEFQAINKLGDAEPESHYRNTSSQIELQFMKPNFQKQNLPPDQLKAYLRKMGLSALLGKTNKPDMMSLYKSLSSSQNGETQHKILKSWSSIKYPTPRIETSHLGDGLSHLHVSSSPIQKPIAVQFDNVIDGKITHPVNHINSKVFWNQAKPIGDLGSQSPKQEKILDHAAMSNLDSHPILGKLYPRPFYITENSAKLIPDPKDALPRPAKIIHVDYEKVDSKTNLPTQQPAYLVPPAQTNQLNPDSIQVQQQPKENKNTNKNVDVQNTAQKINENKKNGQFSRQDLLSYYINSRVHPNGIPMYENRRDHTTYPDKEQLRNAKNYFYSIKRKRSGTSNYLQNKQRKRRSDDEDFENLFSSKESDQNIEDEIGFMELLKRTRRDIHVVKKHLTLSRVRRAQEFEENTFFDKIPKNKREISIVRRGLLNLEAKTNSFHNNKKLAEIENYKLMTRLYGEATLTEMPEQKQQRVGDSAVRSQMPTMSDFINEKTPTVFKKNQLTVYSKGRDSNVVPLTMFSQNSMLPTRNKALVKNNTTNRFIPYKKKIERPVIVDIPTGRLVATGISFERNDKSAGVANFDATDSSSSKLSIPNINVMSEAEVRHGINSNVKANVQATVDVHCKTGDADCVRKNAAETPDPLHSKPASQVVDEVQVPETPTANTTPTPTIHTTKALTTSIPTADDRKPTIDPDYQDVDETEPEEETPKTENKASGRPNGTDEKEVIKPKPEISITIINKTNGVSIDTTIESGKKKPEEEKEKPTEEKKPNEETTEEKNLAKEEKPLVTIEQEKEKEEKTSKEENDLIFTYEDGDGKGEHAPMFGGDIIVTLDIAEELTKYVQDQQDGPTLQEVEEFVQTASAVLDDKNKMEWKNTIKHLKMVANDVAAENNDKSTDNEAMDWRQMHIEKSAEKKNLLLNFINTIETYGNTVSSTFSRYNAKYQQPIITKNIIMQVRVIVVEELLERKNSDIIFPEYASDNRLTKWSSGVEKISLPSQLITKKFEQTKTFHVTFFRIKTVALLERTPKDQGESDDDLVDDNPIKVGSQLLSMNVSPSIGNELNLPVSLTFANDDLSEATLPHICSYWNNTLNKWAENGCKLKFANASVTVCECNHLTSFAVLVDTSKDGKSPNVNKPLPEVSEKKPEAPDNEKVDQVGIKGGKVKLDKEKGERKPEKEKPEEDKELKEEEKQEEKEKKEEEERVKQEKEEKEKKGRERTEKEKEEKEKQERDTTVAPPVETGPQETPEHKKQTDKERRNKWFWILLLILLLLLLLILLLICCCCCCCKRRKAADETHKDAVSESSEPYSGGSENLIDKSKQKEDPKKGLVTPGSTSSSRTSSPEPGQSPGWRKLMINAHNPKQQLLKEKALLFKDYVQPYHFLSNENERPNTSSESLFGSTVTSYPPTTKSEQSPQTTPKRKRSYEPKFRRERSPLPIQKEVINPALEVTKSDSSESSPEIIKREPFKRERLRRRNSDDMEPAKTGSLSNNVPSNTTEATSMEWDPYLENKQKRKHPRELSRRKRSISPISEEDEEEGAQPRTSMEVQPSSDILYSPASSEVSYLDSGSVRTESSEDTSPPILRRGERTSTTDMSSSPKTSDKGVNTPPRTRDQPRTNEVSRSQESSPRESSSLDQRFTKNR